MGRPRPLPPTPDPDPTRHGEDTAWAEAHSLRDQLHRTNKRWEAITAAATETGQAHVIAQLQQEVKQSEAVHSQLREHAKAEADRAGIAEGRVADVQAELKELQRLMADQGGELPKLELR